MVKEGVNPGGISPRRAQHYTGMSKIKAREARHRGETNVQSRYRVTVGGGDGQKRGKKRRKSLEYIEGDFYPHNQELGVTLRDGSQGMNQKGFLTTKWKTIKLPALGRNSKRRKESPWKNVTPLGGCNILSARFIAQKSSN